MTTILAAFADSGPYTKPMRLKVVGVTDVNKYGDGKQCLRMVVSDGHSIIVCLAYDPSKFNKLTMGSFVVARDVIRKKEDGQQTLVFTRNTKLFLTSSVGVSEELTTQAQALLHPPPAPVTPINTALLSTKRQRVSIQGKIVQLPAEAEKTICPVLAMREYCKTRALSKGPLFCHNNGRAVTRQQEEEERSITVKGEETPIKMITVEDASGKSPVTMWRRQINYDVHPGDFVHITDLIVSTYNNVNTFLTTTKSEVKKTDAPEELQEVIVTGISVEGQETSLLVDDEDIVMVPTELLLAACREGQSPEEGLCL
ncbi:hypothetical protein MAR_009553 [Mya arenaria]|uniref:Uncharacterized protein n=1 Tax=Mya arenaria TaxID=6604 RepID=A0ABY7E212_MYAAR|nr:hypothetical protein MAR_009553 [Mya arenaria]